jgi:hypothetical protein
LHLLWTVNAKWREEGGRLERGEKAAMKSKSGKLLHATSHFPGFPIAAACSPFIVPHLTARLTHLAATL